jgi:hypothetical protein
LVLLLLKEPEPDVDQVAPEAPPPNDPAMLMVVLEQAAVLVPALTVAAGLMVNTNELLTAPQGPTGSLVVYVRVILVGLVGLISAALGVYTAVGDWLLNVPVPDVVQVAEVAPPP